MGVHLGSLVTCTGLVLTQYGLVLTRRVDTVQLSVSFFGSSVFPPSCVKKTETNNNADDSRGVPAVERSGCWLGRESCGEGEADLAGKEVYIPNRGQSFHEK